MQYIYKHVLVKGFSAADIQAALDVVAKESAEYRLIDAITIFDGEFTILIFWSTRNPAEIGLGGVPETPNRSFRVKLGVKREA